MKTDLLWMSGAVLACALLAVIAWEKAQHAGWGIVIIGLVIGCGCADFFLGIDAWQRHRERKRTDRICAELVAAQQRWKRAHNR